MDAHEPAHTLHTYTGMVSCQCIVDSYHAYMRSYAAVYKKRSPHRRQHLCAEALLGVEDARVGEGEGEPPEFQGRDLDESNDTKTVVHVRAEEHVSELQAAHLCAEALLGVETASGVGEGESRCEGSRAATSTETASREGRRSRGPRSPSRSALLRRQAFFSCGFRQVAHCMHRLGRL